MVISLSVLSVIVLSLLFLPALGNEQNATVTFYSDGKVYSIQEIEIGQTLEVPTTPPLPDGMVSFVGWSVNETDLENIYNFSTPVTENFNLYAQFSDKHLISFKDADGEIYKTELIEADGYVSMPETPPVSEGKLFLYWTVGDSSEIYLFDTPVNSNFILTPNYGDAHYIYFNSMKGSSVESQSVADGGYLSEPQNPTRQGYVFAHWSTNKDADPNDTTSAFDFSGPITQSLSLYAIWKPDTANMPDVKVIVWKEKERLPIQFDKTDPTNYVYFDSYITGALAGSVLTVTENEVKQSLSETPPFSEFYRSIPVIVEGDGTTITNVYYTSTLYNVTFNLNESGAQMKVFNETYSGSKTYSVQIKLNMNLEDIWPVNGQENFEISRSGKIFYGWLPPSDLNDYTRNQSNGTNGTQRYIIATKHLICSPDLLPDENYTASNGNGYTINGYWLNESIAANISLNYMFEILPGKTPSGTLGKDYVYYDGSGTNKTYIRNTQYSQDGVISTAQLNKSYALKTIDGKNNLTERSLRYNSTTLKLEPTPAYIVKEHFLVYDRERYNLEFDTLGGNSISNISGILSEQSLQDFSIPEPTRSGHEFIGWYEDADYNMPFDLNNSTMPNRDLLLFARWEPTELTATFYDSNGGKELGVQNVASGSVVRAPEKGDPYYLENGKSYENLGIFKGWYYTKPSGLVVPFDFSEPVHENVTLYGLYQTSGFTITYDKAGGTGVEPTDNERYKLNVLAQVKNASLTKDGKVLAGWQEKDKAGMIYYPNSTIKMYGHVNFEAVYTDIGTLTNLTYHSNFGETPQTIKDPVIIGNQYSLRHNQTFEREGFILKGWSENPGDLQPRYDCGQIFTIPAGETTLYAIWAHDGTTYYNVTYKANGGTGADHVVSVIPGENTTIISNGTAQMGRVGHAFNGWNTEPVGTGTDYAEGTKITPTADMTLHAQWTHDGSTFYNITYKPNGGNGTDHIVSVIPGEKHTIVSNATAKMSRIGHTFDGWNTIARDAGAKYTAGEEIIPLSDMTLYAKWTHNGNTYYNITYKANGGTGADHVVSVIPGDNHSIISNATAHMSRAGHAFSGWTENADGTGTSYTTGSSVTPTANMTLYAKWTHDGNTYYNVTYNANGGIGPEYTVRVIPGEKHSVLSNENLTISRIGHDFSGWTETSAGTDPVYTEGDEVTPAGDMMLYAKWTHDGNTFYNITYKANNGTGADYTVKVPPGEKHTVLSNDTAGMENSGNNFVKWATQADGTGEDYMAGEEMTPTDNMTLYAIWTPDGTTIYNVTYKANGGSGADHIVKVISGEKHTVVTNYKAKIEKEGFNFVKWTTGSDGTGTVYLPDAEITVTADVTLYANWVHDGSTYYTVTYKTNGGTGADHTERVTPGEKHSVASVQETGMQKQGFDFVKWTAQADGSGTEYTPGTEITPTANLTLFANWTHDGTTFYNVTYKANGGTGADHTEKVIPGEVHSIPTNDAVGMAKVGYDFVKWTTEADGSGTEFVAGAEIIPAADVTLFANWDHDGNTYYNVTYKANGGTGADYTVKIIPGDDHEIADDQTAKMSKKGYILTAWTENENGGGASYTPGDKITPVSDMTLFARWEYDGVTSFGITYDPNTGSGGKTEQVKSGEKHTVLTKEEAAVIKAGYLFKEWNTQAGGTGKTYAPGTEITPEADMTLFAQWEVHPGRFTVTYDVNGGEGTPPQDPKQYMYDETVTVLSNETISKSGYKFENWNTEKDGTGKAYGSGNEFNIQNDTALYAVWKSNGSSGGGNGTGNPVVNNSTDDDNMGGVPGGPSKGNPEQKPDPKKNMWVVLFIPLAISMFVFYTRRDIDDSKIE